MINITLGVALGSPNMKYPKNWFEIMNITQIPEMNPARGFCFSVHCLIQTVNLFLITGLNSLSKIAHDLLSILSKVVIEGSIRRFDMSNQR